jgi:hypothetical protein
MTCAPSGETKVAAVTSENARAASRRMRNEMGMSRDECVVAT